MRLREVSIMSLRSITRLALVVAALFLSPAVASAHPGFGAHAGFAAGFMHPLSGLDHVLAMTAVGLLAARLGRRGIWVVPLSFMAVMALGGALGMAGVELPFVGTMLAVSLVVLGLAVAMPRRCPLLAAMLMVGVFGLFHGHAHGSEMPLTASGLDYGAGFLAAAGLLHLLGIGLGCRTTLLAPARAVRMTRLAGLMTTAIGVALLGSLM
jgi:urease accessory protein